MRDPKKLTPREEEIVRTILDSLSVNETAARLSIAAGTIRIHRRNALDKLGCVSAIDLRARVSDGSVVLPPFETAQTAE